MNIVLGDPQVFCVPNGWDRIKEFYGENKVVEQAHGSCKGDPTWEHDNLVVLKSVCKTGCNVQLHRLVAPIFESCLRSALDQCPGYKVRMLGGYCARHKRNDPKADLSIHTYGAAFDINWDTNPMGKKLVTDLPKMFIKAFTKNGWVWGGDFSSPKDAMHFQLALGV